MYAGRIVETGPTAAILERPRHPYTLGLLRGGRRPRQLAARCRSRSPALSRSPAQLPPGCPFTPRCPLAGPECSVAEIPLEPIDAERRVACLHHDLVPAP